MGEGNIMLRAAVGANFEYEYKISSKLQLGYLFVRQCK